MIMIKKSFLILISLIALLSLDYCNSDILEVPFETPPYKQRGIWIVGGANQIAASGITIYSQIDLYDPVTDTWYPDVAADATGTYIPAVFSMAASVSGKIYVMGGTPNATTVTNSVYEYDISSNSWSSKSTNPSLMDAAVYVYNGKIYLIGGTNTVTTSGVQTTHYVFDPASSGGSGSWTTLNAYTTARSSMGAADFNGIVCYAGGRIAGGGGSATNDIFMVNINAYSLSSTEQVLTSARGGMAYAGYEGSNGTYLFLVGGASAFTAATAYFGLTAITYAPQASSFQVYVPPATASGILTGAYHPAFTGGTTTGIVFGSAAVSPYNGSSAVDPTLYVFGGINSGLTVTNAVYSITANGLTSSTNYAPGASWTAKTSMPRPRYGFSAITINQ